MLTDAHIDLRSKFSAIHREYSPNPRKFYAFCTSVTDTATTAGIIASGACPSFPTSLPLVSPYKKIKLTLCCIHSVRDMVVRQHLKQSKLL
jgi:guanine nucleotide-binding protein subunit alpha